MEEFYNEFIIERKDIEEFCERFYEDITSNSMSINKSRLQDRLIAKETHTTLPRAFKIFIEMKYNLNFNNFKISKSANKEIKQKEEKQEKKEENIPNEKNETDNFEEKKIKNSEIKIEVSKSANKEDFKAMKKERDEILYKINELSQKNEFLEEKQKDLEEDYKVVDYDRKKLKEKFHLKTGIDPDEFYKVKEFYMKNIGNFPQD